MPERDNEPAVTGFISLCQNLTMLKLLFYCGINQNWRDNLVAYLPWLNKNAITSYRPETLEQGYSSEHTDESVPECQEIKIEEHHV